MAERIILSEFRFRRGAAAVWTTNNPILGPGEPGFETDTKKVKLGNGTDAWNDLTYLQTELAGVLSAIAALTMAAGDAIYFTDADTAATFSTTSFMRTLMGSADSSAVRSAIGIGDHGSRIGTLEGDVAALQSSDGSQDSTLSDHASRIAALESALAGGVSGTFAPPASVTFAGGIATAAS